MWFCGMVIGRLWSSELNKFPVPHLSAIHTVIYYIYCANCNNSENFNNKRETTEHNMVCALVCNLGGWLWLQEVEWVVHYSDDQ